MKPNTKLTRRNLLKNIGLGIAVVSVPMTLRAEKTRDTIKDFYHHVEYFCYACHRKVQTPCTDSFTIYLRTELLNKLKTCRNEYGTSVYEFFSNCWPNSKWIENPTLGTLVPLRIECN